MDRRREVFVRAPDRARYAPGQDCVMTTLLVVSDVGRAVRPLAADGVVVHLVPVPRLHGVLHEPGLPVDLLHTQASGDAHGVLAGISGVHAAVARTVEGEVADTLVPGRGHDPPVLLVELQLLLHEEPLLPRVVGRELDEGGEGGRLQGRDGLDLRRVLFRLGCRGVFLRGREVGEEAGRGEGGEEEGGKGETQNAPKCRGDVPGAKYISRKTSFCQRKKVKKELVLAIKRKQEGNQELIVYTFPIWQEEVIKSRQCSRIFCRAWFRALCSAPLRAHSSSRTLQARRFNFFGRLHE